MADKVLLDPVLSRCLVHQWEALDGLRAIVATAYVENGWEAEDGSGPDFILRKQEEIVDGYVRGSQSHRWAWDALVALDEHLTERGAPSPLALRKWAVAARKGDLKAPWKCPKAERDFDIVRRYSLSRSNGQSYEASVEHVAAVHGMQLDAVRKVLNRHRGFRNYFRHLYGSRISVKRPSCTYSLDGGFVADGWREFVEGSGDEYCCDLSKFPDECWCKHFTASDPPAYSSASC